VQDGNNKINIEKSSQIIYNTLGWMRK